MKKQTLSKKSILINVLVAGGLIFSAFFKLPTAYAALSVDSSFNPDKIIDDKIFSDKNAMSAADIQKFLEDKKSVLANTSNSFLMQLKEPVDNQNTKQILEDPHAASNTPRTAAQLIYDASNSAGLNPQVLLVSLNKEQSLITGRQTATPEQLQRALDFALGFGCPDSQPCGAVYQGFYFQLFGGVDTENNRYLGAARSLMKSFSTPGGRGPYYNGGISKVGDTIELNNTVGDYDGVQPTQRVRLSNNATAALYRYTPHVFNGNYNFFKFYKAWFGSPTSGGSDSPATNGLIKVSGNADLYILENGGVYKVLPFVAKARKISTTKYKKVSKSQFATYNNFGLYAVPDFTLIKVGTQYYLFVNNKKVAVTTDVLKARNISANKAIIVKSTDANQYETGTSLDPSPIVSSPPPTPSTPTPPSQGGQLMTGAIIKSASSSTVYLYEDGKKKPMDGEIFRNRGFSFNNLMTVPDDQLNALQLGSMPLPVDNTYFKDKKTGQLYVYRDGKKSSISAFVAKQRNITPDFTFGEDITNNLPNGKPILPKTGTIFKGDKKADVFLMNLSSASPMTLTAFQARNIKPADLNILPQAEVDSYPKGALLSK